MPPRHRFLEPIHNVKEEPIGSLSAPAAAVAKLVVFIPGEMLTACEPLRRQSRQSRALWRRPAALAELAAGAN